MLGTYFRREITAANRVRTVCQNVKDVKLDANPDDSRSYWLHIAENSCQ